MVKIYTRMGNKRFSREFLQGLYKIDQGFALALDIDRVLSSNEQVAVRDLATETQA